MFVRSLEFVYYCWLCSTYSCIMAMVVSIQQHVSNPLKFHYNCGNDKTLFSYFFNTVNCLKKWKHTFPLLCPVKLNLISNWSKKTWIRKSLVLAFYPMFYLVTNTYFQMVFSKPLGDHSKGTNYNWYHHHLWNLEIFQLSGKIQVLVNHFAIFKFFLYGLLEWSNLLDDKFFVSF